MMNPNETNEQIEWASYDGWWITTVLKHDSFLSKDNVRITCANDTPSYIMGAARLWAGSNFLYEMDLQEFLKKTLDVTPKVQLIPHP